MTVRNIVHIDRDKCDGCGQCVSACAEGAIEIVDGKAVLVSDVYCDGLGACLGHCPRDAITIEQREARAFDEHATAEHLAGQGGASASPVFVCPGLAALTLSPAAGERPAASGLTQWPAQLKLVPVTAPYFANADLLLAADCVPFAMADFHRRFLQGRRIAVGCPKLDDAEFYVKKLASILAGNAVKSLTVVHMQVPCCSGLTRVARAAIRESGRPMCFDDVTISLQGDVIGDETVRATAET